MPISENPNKRVQNTNNISPRESLKEQQILDALARGKKRENGVLQTDAPFHDDAATQSSDIHSINIIEDKHEEKEEDEKVQRVETSASEKPYSSFTNREKYIIVMTATAGAFFSPFSAQIYFPALNTLAKDLHVSSSQINLTLTTYLIFQAIAPAFIGGFSDTAGRRPAYMICFVIYIIANIALALQNSYVALLILRMVQSGGSSGTVALANAVVADVATSAERGTFIALTSLTSILAPSLGPILGGVLSEYAGWRWIFWFLTILASLFFIPALLFFPETCRKIVGDGSIPPPSWNRSLLNRIDEKKRREQGIEPDYAERDALAKDRRITFPNPLATLIILYDKEVALILMYAGLIYAGFYAVMAGMPSQLSNIYGYNQLEIGLLYLPLCGGSLISAFTQGKLVDWNYARHATKLGMELKKTRMQDLTNFPIERARLEIAFPTLFLASASTIGYGWAIMAQTSIAVPIIMLVIMGYSLVAATQTISILIVDINPTQAGSATAAFNLVRCLLGAGATAIIVPLTDAIHYGWSYTVIAIIYLALTPILFIVMRKGPQWRKEKRAREEKRAEEKRRKKEAAASKV